MVAAALPDGAAIVHLDITSQLRIQEQLRTANSHLRTVIDCSPVAIITFSAQGQVLSWNRGAERIFGWTEEEAVGRPLPGLFPNQEPGCVGRLLEQAAQPNSEAMEVQRPHKDGRKLEIRLWTRRIPTAEDQPDHFLTVAEDITEARRVEEQLRHALKMEAMGRLAGGVAHDFSNLLTVMLGFGGLLEQKLPAEAPGGREAREMLLAAERASALTAQLLAFSRRQMRKSRPVYVNQLIGNIERMLRRLIGEDIELAIELTPQLAPVLADPQDIELAIVNLAVNARDAMPNGGRLEIVTRPAEASREGLDPSTRWI
jgi:PAS domain S-box-containing protein